MENHGKSPVRNLYCVYLEKSSWVRHGAGVGATGVGLRLGHRASAEIDHTLIQQDLVYFGVNLCPKISKML